MISTQPMLSLKPNQKCWSLYIDFPKEVLSLRNAGIHLGGRVVACSGWVRGSSCDADEKSDQRSNAQMDPIKEGQKTTFPCWASCSGPRLSTWVDKSRDLSTRDTVCLGENNSLVLQRNYKTHSWTQYSRWTFKRPKKFGLNEDKQFL